MLVLGHDQAELFANCLESMAEHAMADVVQQGGGHGDLSLVLAILTTAGLDMAPDDPHQCAGDMEHAEAMREAGMGGAGKYELEEAELADAAQALERRCLDHLP